MNRQRDLIKYRREAREVQEFERTGEGEHVVMKGTNG
jgi:hypothetical protein